MRFVSYMTPGFPVTLFETIAAEIGAELHLVQTQSGPSPHEDPFRDGRFDLGWVCSTSFVDLNLRSAVPSVQLAGVAWIPDDPDSDGRPCYFGDVLVAADSALESLDDLAGLRIGCNDPISLSGHHALRFTLQARGHDPDTFAELTFTGGHHASLDAIVAGELDAVVVDSVVRLGRARHDQPVAGLRILERLGPWPTQPLVARRDLDPALVAEVRDVLLGAGSRPGIAEQLSAAALAGLARVGDDHYEPVHHAMRRAEGR